MMSALGLPACFILGSIASMLTLSSAFSWLYAVAYFRRVRDGRLPAGGPTPSAASSWFLHRGPWLLILTAWVVYWLLSTPRTSTGSWFLYGLLAGLAFVLVVAAIGYRRGKARAPSVAPEPRGPRAPAAPWAGQPVRRSFLLLARMMVGFGLVSVLTLLWLGDRVDSPPLVISDAPFLLAGTYGLCVLLFVCIKGRAPMGWLPWR